MITKEQAIDLCKLTMVDCPLPSVADMLCAIGPEDGEKDNLMDFLKFHYTRIDLDEGVDEYFRRIKYVNELFGENSEAK